MRKFILAVTALASLAVPLAAQAYPGELRDDRRDVRQETRELRQAQRTGDRGDIREQRRDVRDARQEYREDSRDRRDGNWRRDVRDDRRDGRRGYYDNRRSDWRAERRYDAGRYYYPRGHAYRAWAVGGFLPRSYWGERYWVGRPTAYGLPYAGRDLRWIRVGPDALLIRARNGSVVRVVRGIFY